MMRVLIYVLLFYLGYKFLKPWVTSLIQAHGKEAPNENGDTELIRDPQCGTYFLKSQGVAAHVGGKRLYFCTPECRDKYIEEQTP